MNDFRTSKIDDRIINKYLDYKNLSINRKYSSSKKIISKIDHYIWWFQKQQKRTSFIIEKQKKNFFISTSDHFNIKKDKLIYSGLLSCLPETNLFDLLKAIKIQNQYLASQKNTYCFISIDKNNKVLMHHWKYFGYNPLNKGDYFYGHVKKKLNISQNFNIFFKKIKK